MVTGLPPSTKLYPSSEPNLRAHLLQLGILRTQPHAERLVVRAEDCEALLQKRDRLLAAAARGHALGLRRTSAAAAFRTALSALAVSERIASATSRARRSWTKTC